MKPTWVVQSNLLNSKDHDTIKSTCEKNNYSFHSVKVIPFSDDLADISGIPVEYPTIFYGGTNFVTTVHESAKWNPGAFFNKDTFTIRACMEHYQGYMLNHPCEFTTIEKFASAHKSPDDLFFIRPNKDLKEFAGDIFDFNRIVKWERALRHLPGVENNPKMTKETEIVVCDPVGIAHEWRLFIVNGSVSSGSHYRAGRKLEVSPDLPPRVKEFGEDMCKIWMPAPVFVMDIAESAGVLYIIECNCFNSSGFYDSNLEKIIVNVTDFCMLLEKVPNFP